MDEYEALTVDENGKLLGAWTRIDSSLHQEPLPSNSTKGTESGRCEERRECADPSQRTIPSKSKEVHTYLEDATHEDRFRILEIVGSLRHRQTVEAYIAALAV